MTTNSILPVQLKTFEYYKKKLPLYLQNSHGFQEHFKIWYDIMVGYSEDNSNLGSDDYNGVIQVGDTMLYLIDIFDGYFDDNGVYVNSYLQEIVRLDNTWPENATEEFKQLHPYGTRSDILDKLGNLFGVKRDFVISYNYMGQQVNNEAMSLDNQDFLIYIKMQIIKNYCNGSYIQLQEYYASAGLQLFITTSSEIATSLLYLASFQTITTLTDLQKLFFAGELRVESMGIKYQESVIDVNNVLIWDRAVETGGYGGWDNAQWL